MKSSIGCAYSSGAAGSAASHAGGAYPTELMACRCNIRFTIQFPSRRAGKWAFLLRARTSSVADSKFQNGRDCLRERLHFSIQASGKGRPAIRDDPDGPRLHVEPESAVA